MLCSCNGSINDSHVFWCSLLTELTKLSEAGVALASRVYSLEYGGEVSRHGNCLFEALAVAMGSFETASEVRFLRTPLICR